MCDTSLNKGRKWTIADRIITGINTLRFEALERIKLRISRTKYEKFYTDRTENPLVTIYTPTYNRGELLVDRALSSVLNQTYHNFEYLIIGDHCTDNTKQLLCQVNDPRIKFYNLPQKSRGYPVDAEAKWLAGPVIPANKALELARGKWIARLDDDDTFSHDHIDLLLRFAQNENFEFVSAQYVEERFGERTVVDGIRTRDPYYTHREIEPNDDSPKIGGTSTWLYRSYLRFFKYNINCWRKRWNRVNDIDISLRIFKAGVRMGFLDQVVLYVLPRPGEKTVGLDAYMLAEKEGFSVHS